MKKSGALVMRPIGVIRTPFEAQEGTPIQPYAARDVEGLVEINPEYREALRDLFGFSRIWLIYGLHQAAPFSARVIPYRDSEERGLFATRAPCRPNPIGLSAVRLLDVEVESGILKVLDVDMLNGTPLMDIKPYVPQFDSYPDARIGWLDRATGGADVADSRFSVLRSDAPLRRLKGGNKPAK